MDYGSQYMKSVVYRAPKPKSLHNLRTLKLPSLPLNTRMEASFQISWWRKFFYSTLTNIIYKNWEYQMWCGCSHETGLQSKHSSRSCALLSALFPTNKKITKAPILSVSIFYFYGAQVKQINFHPKNKQKTSIIAWSGRNEILKSEDYIRNF